MPFPMLLGVRVLNGAKHSPRLGHYVDHRRPRWRVSKSGYSIDFMGVFIHARSRGAKPSKAILLPTFWLLFSSAGFLAAEKSHREVSKLRLSWDDSGKIERV